MPALLAHQATIALKAAKPNGLNDLGVPIDDTTEVKKGKLGEFDQPLEGGKPGRRFQNIRVILVKTTEGGAPSAKAFVQFEVFGDDNVPLAANTGFALHLLQGDARLGEVAQGEIFLPYARCWYDNRYVFDIPDAAFAAEQVTLLVHAEAVREI